MNDSLCKNCFDVSRPTQMNSNVTQKMRTPTLTDAKDRRLRQQQKMKKIKKKKLTKKQKMKNEGDLKTLSKTLRSLIVKM